MRKDYKLAVDTASDVGATLLLGDAGLQAYTDAMNDPRCYDKDSRVVFRYIGGDEDWQIGASD
jgi:3-hydroxyisobutyrate dehydrogenase